MAGSYFKHFNEQNHDKHGGQLFWNGGIGGGNIPFRGAGAPTLTREELETQVSVVKDFNCELFDLSDPEQHQRFTWIMDRIYNGWFVLGYIDRKMIAEQKTVIVYIEWAQRYGELSPAAKSARKQGHVYQYPPAQPDSATVSLSGLQPPNLGVS